MAIRRVTRAGVGLVVGIIILALLVWWGLWAVQQRGEQARQQEAINIAEEQLESESNGGVALNPQEGSTNGSENNGSGSEGSTSGSGDSETIPQTSTSPHEPSDADELPQTGPEAGSIATAGLVTFALISYIRSRKLVLEQL